MRGGRLLIAAVAVAVAVPGAAPGAAGAAVKGNTITDGKARFQVLTPTLIRLEYAGEGGFENRPTLTVSNRRLRARFKTSVRKGVRVIRTSRMTLRYKRGSGGFDGGNVLVLIRSGKRTIRANPRFKPPPGPPPPPPNPPSRTQAPPNPDPATPRPRARRATSAAGRAGSTTRTSRCRSRTA